LRKKDEVRSVSCGVITVCSECGKLREFLKPSFSSKRRFLVVGDLEIIGCLVKGVVLQVESSYKKLRCYVKECFDQICQAQEEEENQGSADGKVVINNK